MNDKPKQPRIGPDGCIYALCPRCGTPGTRFAPEPGAYIQQLCPRPDCRLVYHIYVWPHWREAMLMTGEAVVASVRHSQEDVDGS